MTDSDWAINIVGNYETRPASWFLANDRNFRTHPWAQAAAMDSALDLVGWIARVIVNLRDMPEWGDGQGESVVLNGHLRVMRALARGDNTPVPVEFVNLTPEQEKIALATFDRISEMAGKDSAILEPLLRETMGLLDDPALRVMMSEMARDAKIYLNQIEADIPPEVSGEQIDLDSIPTNMMQILITCDSKYGRVIGDFVDSLPNCKWVKVKMKHDKD